MDVVMSPDAIELYRLILAEGPRFPDLVKKPSTATSITRCAPSGAQSDREAPVERESVMHLGHYRSIREARHAA
jgi:hypothetical protein